MPCSVLFCMTMKTGIVRRFGPRDLSGDITRAEAGRAVCLHSVDGEEFQIDEAVGQF